MRIFISLLYLTFLVFPAVSAGDENRPVAFAALLKDRPAAAAVIKGIGKQHAALKNAGIKNLQFFTRKIGGKEVILATMDMNASALSGDAAESWSAITASPLFKNAFARLNRSILPHPRHAGSKKSPWVHAETICVLRPANAAPATRGDHPWYAAVTGLKKEKEAEYRLLHNNVWPGVIHAIGESNISRFDIFLIEFGDNQPHLFYLFQYTGKDFETDMKAQSNSPVNQRWWKFTDACQQPLPAAAAEKKVWLDLKKLP